MIHITDENVPPGIAYLIDPNNMSWEPPYRTRRRRFVDWVLRRKPLTQLEAIQAWSREINTMLDEMSGVSDLSRGPHAAAIKQVEAEIQRSYL